jgi:Holliday junction resolvase RusA-like endonuclease|tara:strand:- start:2144 stop:2533 length:390 start_codon:yes stop_codon:yes gene_type:complete
MFKTLEIVGEPASKANSRKIVIIKGRPASIKSDKARAYAKAFADQCTADKELFEGDVCVEMLIYYASRRPDLDESLILDLMQGIVYKNDRQVKEKHIYWGLDRENPRTIIRVSPMESGSVPSYLRRIPE